MRNNHVKLYRDFTEWPHKLPNCYVGALSYILAHLLLAHCLTSLRSSISVSLMPRWKFLSYSSCSAQIWRCVTKLPYWHHTIDIEIYDNERHMWNFKSLIRTSLRWWKLGLNIWTADDDDDDHYVYNNEHRRKLRVERDANPGTWTHWCTVNLTGYGALPHYEVPKKN